MAANMNGDKIYVLSMNPGILRDGTSFARPNWIDGEWTRFYRGLPQKMGGYQQISSDSNSIVRGLYNAPNGGNYNVFLGDASSLNVLPMDFQANPLGPLINRTPANFVANDFNEWSFDVMYSTLNASSTIIAHAAPNLQSIDSGIQRPIYYGDLLGTDPLIQTGISVSGGISVFQPYLFMLDNDGFVMWSEANDPTTIMGDARIAPYKLVAALPTRGGNSSPAGLIWSLDRLIRVTQVGTTSIEFAFDTVTAESSIMSSNSIVEVDGVFYWCGIDRFLYYNGVVNELPNNMSLEFFFDSVNFAQRQKIWATKYPFKGEIWWHFPKDNSIECNHAVIFNYRENTWYDTPINRSCGYYDQTFQFPIWADNQPNGSNAYPIWAHEIGTDQNVNGNLTAIPASVESGAISWVAIDAQRQNAAFDRWVYLYRFEPDFIQTGAMTLTVNGRQYARAPVVSSTYNFDETTIKIDMREQRREMTLAFASDAIGGYFEMGQCLMVMRLGDARQSPTGS